MEIIFLELHISIFERMERTIDKEKFAIYV